MKPTVVLEMTGAYDKNPARRRTNEPNTGRGVGKAPDHLTDEAKKVWDEIVSNCAPGVFQSSDRIMLEALSTMMVDFRANPDFGGRKYTALVALLGHCGMTPSHRSKIFVPSGKEEKPKSGLASFR